jgi:hypothetical protein
MNTRHLHGATALLAHQGLGPTTTGGHIAVGEAMRAQFPRVPGLSSLDPLHPDEAHDAIAVANGLPHQHHPTTRPRRTRRVLNLLQSARPNRLIPRTRTRTAPFFPAPSPQTTQPEQSPTRRSAMFPQVTGGARPRAQGHQRSVEPLPSQIPQPGIRVICRDDKAPAQR